ncbi:MAG TPA: hypothetical protein VN742_00400 [Candidatus Binataceae bacterium]|nr:hypothetical protein [Candidatus Binataceae bacterium]
MQNVDARIAELEAQVATQATEIADLRSRLPAPRIVTAPVEDGVTITHPSPISSYIAPSEKELERLYAGVFARHPGLEPTFVGKFADEDFAHHFKSFRGAFTRIGFLGRADVPDQKRYLNFWIDEADDWLRSHRMNDGNTGAGYFVAAIAHGDVPYSLSDAFGNRAAVGLRTWGGKPATDAWRRVLKGEILAPTPGKYPGPERTQMRNDGRLDNGA